MTSVVVWQVHSSRSTKRWRRSVRREHPFAFALGGGEPLITGVIDLLATEQGGGCVVLDYKSDALDDPMINEWHVRVLGMATQAEIDRMVELTLKVNAVLRPFVAERGIVLVDMKLEFGRHHGTIILGDEICPDTCRFWDSSSGEKLDKDRFRRDLGRVEEAYEEIARRVGA